MQIVIDIPEEKYDAIKSNYNTFPAEMKEWGLEAIRNGTPLPKRMLSVDLIVETLCPKDEDYDYPCIAPSYLEEELERLLLDDAPTIIEADTESEG